MAKAKKKKSNSKKIPTLPTRTQDHRIDSLAIRFIRNNIPDSWIDRDLSERDYGIDMAIEIFQDSILKSVANQQIATGLLSLIQVKGTTNKLAKKNGHYIFPGFPTKTLKYARTFKIPFFAIIVYLDKNKSKSQAHYLWLQDFLKNDGNGFLNPKWESRKTTTLYIPIGNDFVKSQDDFERCIRKDHFDIKFLEIFRMYYIVKAYTDALPHVQLPGVMDFWLDLLMKIKELSFFDLNEIVEPKDIFCQFDWNKTTATCKSIKNKNKITMKQITFLQDQIKKIDEIIDYSLCTEKLSYN